MPTLIAELQNKRRTLPKPKVGEKRVSPLDPLQGREGIMRHSELISMMEKALASQAMAKMEYKKLKEQEHRTRLGDAIWHLVDLLGKVNEEIWVGMVEATIESQLKHIRHRQPNGDWVLCEYEYELQPDAEGRDVLMLVTRFVDRDGETDLQYSNGQPITGTTVEVKQSGGLTRDDIMALRGSSDSKAMESILERLVRLQEAQLRVDAAKAGIVLEEDLEEVDPE